MQEPHIELDEVSVRFRLDLEKAGTLKEAFVNMVRGRTAYRDLWALEKVSVSVRQGEAVGIIGRNGSGKSTLLKIVAGVFSPTTGRCAVRGAVSSLIELGAGFNSELTGRENVFLAGAILGLSRAEMQKRYDRIVEFAELGDFMDTAVKNFSSGMYARLGFAVATDLDAEILLIDEILSVGDEAFQKKSYARIHERIEQGRTLIFVSHDAARVAEICSRAVLLHHGRVLHDGPTEQTIAAYRELLASPAA